jgi:hypothetical protein
VRVSKCFDCMSWQLESRLDESMPMPTPMPMPLDMLMEPLEMEMETKGDTTDLTLTR